MAFPLALVLSYLAKGIAGGAAMNVGKAAIKKGAKGIASAVGKKAGKKGAKGAANAGKNAAKMSAKRMKLLPGVARNAMGIVSRGFNSDFPMYNAGLGKIFGDPYLMNILMYEFMMRKLPEALANGRLDGTMLGNLFRSSPIMSDVLRRGFALPSGGTGWAMLGNGGDTGAMSPDAPGPVGKWFGGYPNAKTAVIPPQAFQRLFGWGGSTTRNGAALDEALKRLYEDPISYWDTQIGDAVSIGDPFAEESAERDFMRKQKVRDAALDRMLDSVNQEYVSSKLKKYYRKGMGQWAAEKVPEALGMVAQTAGDAASIYNSALANALMQSAASKISKAQADRYGNPYMQGAALLAGARNALGGIGGSLGKNIGGFLKDWSDDIAGEFERQRALRLNLDTRPSGMFMDSYYKLGKPRKRSSSNAGE